MAEAVAAIGDEVEVQRHAVAGPHHGAAGVGAHQVGERRLIGLREVDLDALDADLLQGVLGDVGDDRQQEGCEASLPALLPSKLWRTTRSP